MRRFWLIAALLLAFALPGAAQTSKGHRVLAADNGRVALIGADGKVAWEMPNRHTCHDITLLPNGNLVIGNCHAGPENPQLVEVTRDKKVVWTFKDFATFGNGLAAAHVLPDAKGRVVR